IAEMARMVAHKTVEESHFGLADECLALGRKIRELVARARSERNISDALRRRAKYLHGSLRFEQDAPVPIEGSLRSFPDRIADAGGALNSTAEEIRVNVLTLDYWGLSQVLLR